MTDKVQRQHDFDAVITALTQPIDPDQSSVWTTTAYTSGANISHYANPAVDNLLERARTVADCDQASRKRLYDEFQVLVAEDQPYTFLWSVKTVIAVNKRVQNVTPHLWLSSGAIAWDLRNWTLAG